MTLATLVTAFPVQFKASETWSIFGPDAEEIASWLNGQPAQILPFSPVQVAQVDGLILAGALSTQPAAQTEPWLGSVLEQMKLDSHLIVVDWQGDGPLDIGPDLENRLKRGRLSRLLRGAGFGSIALLVDQPEYYVVQAIKTETPAQPEPSYFEVARLDELGRNQMKPVEILGHKIIVANTGKEIVAFAQSCPHSGTLLQQGLLRGRTVVCPLHGYMWNVLSGEPVEPEDEDVLPCYQVKVDKTQNRVWVGISL